MDLQCLAVGHGVGLLLVYSIHSSLAFTGSDLVLLFVFSTGPWNKIRVSVHCTMSIVL